MTVDRTVRITGTEMKETINQFEQDRRSNGTRKAVRSLISEAFLIWMDALEQASAENDESCRVSVTRTECSLDRDTVIRITVGMDEMLSIRDAFLISAIVDEQRASREFLMDFAERPKQPSNAQRLEQLLSDAMYTAGQKDPDFILRPSGEKRLSNFMLWQAAYSELVEMDVLWPDFTRSDLDAAIEEFNHRSRRFGGL